MILKGTDKVSSETERDVSVFKNWTLCLVFTRKNPCWNAPIANLLKVYHSLTQRKRRQVEIFGNKKDTLNYVSGPSNPTWILIAELMSRRKP